MYTATYVPDNRPTTPADENKRLARTARSPEGSCASLFSGASHRGSIDVVTTEGWIFMVGFRVFDVGLLIVWLIWFFRLRDDDDDSRGDDGGGGEGPGPRPRDDGPGGDGIRLPLGRLGTRARTRPRALRPGAGRTAAGAEPRVPSPARVRRPRSPVPTHRQV